MLLQRRGFPFEQGVKELNQVLRDHLSFPF